METPVFCLARQDEPEEKARMIKRFKYHEIPVTFFLSKDELYLHLQTLTYSHVLICSTKHLLINQFKNHLKVLPQSLEIINQNEKSDLKADFSINLGGTENFYLNREKYLASGFTSNCPLFPLFLSESGDQRHNYLLTELFTFQIQQLIFDVYLSTTELLKCHLVVNQNFCLTYPEWLSSLKVKINDKVLSVFSIKGGIGKTNYSVWFNLPPLEGKQKITVFSLISPQILSLDLTIPKIEYLAVTTVLRDEEDYLDEWIRHYLSLGVSRFYLFDHLTKEKEKLRKICQVYPEVTLIDFAPQKDLFLLPYRDLHNYYPQSEQINLVISKYGGSHRWLVLCDVDEFLFVENRINLVDYLLKINDPFLSIETYSFGCRKKGEGELVKTQIFRKPHAEGPDWRTKCIIDPRKVSLMDVHLPVNFFGQRRHVSPNELNFRHYMYRPSDVINRRMCPHGELDSFCLEKEYAVIMYPGKEHYWQEIAEMICYAMEKRGQKCRIMEKISATHRYIALGLNEGPIRDLPSDSIVINMEQLYIGSQWVNENYRSLLSKYTLWDYNLRNLKFLIENWRLSASLFSFGYVPSLNQVSSLTEKEKLEKLEKVDEIEVLVMGHDRNNKRKNIVDSLSSKGIKAVLTNDLWGRKRIQVLVKIKILLNIHAYAANYLETTRICYALNNNLFIISEDSADLNDYPKLGECIISVPYEKLVDTVSHYLIHEKERERFREEAYLKFQAIEPTLPSF